MIKHINRNAAARIPISANAEPYRVQFFHQSLCYPYGAIFMKGGVISKGIQIKLERFTFDQMSTRYIINNNMYCPKLNLNTFIPVGGQLIE